MHADLAGVEEMMSWHYRLEGKIVVPCTLEEWSACMEENDRHVAREEIGDVVISTVFLGLENEFLEDR